MRLNTCHECEFYIMDDGREVSCQYDTPTAYYEIRPGKTGGEVYHCPRELAYGKSGALKLK